MSLDELERVWANLGESKRFLASSCEFRRV